MKVKRNKRLHDIVELNITAFMDLMVVLITFLLISAVFSRLSIIELNLPPANAQANPEQEIKLALQLVVREKSFDVQDVNLGLIKRIDRDASKVDWKRFTDVLLEIKYRFPDEQNITLLLEPGVNYKTMIEVMDHVRTTQVLNNATVETVELFPSISIGDAPDLSLPEPNSTPVPEVSP